MAKFRIQFTKFGDMKYVSHLDLIRLFTRIFHRAELPVLYSEGFNPHPKMAVLLPLSVGTESSCEYIDVDFDDSVSMLDVAKKLKKALPIGMDVPQVTMLNETSKKAKHIRYASYKITVDAPLNDQKLDAFLAQDTVDVLKKTKRSESMADIKPDILHIALETGDETNAVFTAIISAGSNANLKPDLLIEAMKTYIPGFAPENVSILRTGILDERGEPMM